MRDRFGFSARDNLAFAALNGIIYTIAAWQGGRFGQRRGYFNALKFGFGVMILALVGGWWFDSAIGLVLATGAFNVGMCFIWPTIEALVSEGEDAVGLPRMVGTYNVVWAATNVLALFSGGTLVKNSGTKPFSSCPPPSSSPCWPWFSGCNGTRTPPAPTVTNPHPRPRPIRTARRQ